MWTDDMATVGEAIAASIIAQWNVGTGGTKPDPIKYVVEDSERNPNSKVADAVFVWLPLKRDYDNDIDVAEKYRNVTYSIRIECQTKTSAARQLEIENEVDRILASGTPITGATKQKVLSIADVSNRSYSVGAKFVSEILMEVFTAMEESATAYGGATTAALVTDTLEFTAGGGTINRFHDEDNMASDDADGLASQQSIKAYVDAVTTAFQAANMIGAANAAWVNCPFELESADASVLGTGSGLKNIGALDPLVTYQCTWPTTMVGLDLYVSGVRIGLKAANGTNYINQVVVRGNRYNSTANLNDDPTDYNSVQRIEQTFGAINVSSYDNLYAAIVLAVTDAGALIINFVTMRIYYA